MMSEFNLSPRSEENLKGVHPDLQMLVRDVIEHTPFDFTIYCGLRTEAEQRKHVASGASQTMNSRHLTGHAIDFMAYTEHGQPTWDQDDPLRPHYRAIAKMFKERARYHGIPIVSGILDWGWDGPHIELERHVYPAKTDKTPRRQQDEKAAATLGGGAVLTGAAEVAETDFSLDQMVQLIQRVPEDWIVPIGVAVTFYLLLRRVG